jgi:hypothetical protein
MAVPDVPRQRRKPGKLECLIKKRMCRINNRNCARAHLCNQRGIVLVEFCPSPVVRKSEYSRDDPGMIHPAATPSDEPHAAAVE